MYNEVTTLKNTRSLKIMSHYTHLSIEERERSRSLFESGSSIRAIARILGRSPSTISREFKRNSYANGSYAAHHAQKKYTKRKSNCGMKPILESNEMVRNYVMDKLNQMWTPEQICGRAKFEKQPFHISYPTIYRAVSSGIIPMSIKKKMRFMNKHKKRKTTDDNRGKIPNTVNISERPNGCINRSRFGHFGRDTVLGMRKTGLLGTHVERKSGFLVAFKLETKTDKEFSEATIEAFKSIPKKLKKSFTVDNGKEFAMHEYIKEQTGMEVYFCDPYSPWQRGTNENTNGLLRQFFPKGTSLKDVTNEELQKVVDLINNRPRKRLGFKTPLEVLAKFFK